MRRDPWRPREDVRLCFVSLKPGKKTPPGGGVKYFR